MTNPHCEHCRTEISDWTISSSAFARVAGSQMKPVTIGAVFEPNRADAEWRWDSGNETAERVLRNRRFRLFLEVEADSEFNLA
jgi:hypothetical protein